MKEICMVLFLCLMFQVGQAQMFQFSPDSIQRELNLESFSIDQIDITPTYPHDTAYISYRLIENTCPPEWEFILCDWSDCFIDMPNTDDMHPLPNGYNALIKISANPHSTEGAGYLHFWIFPTGSMELHESIYFHYHTPNAIGIENTENKTIHYQINNRSLQIRNAPKGNWKMVDLKGEILKTGHNDTPEFSIDTLNVAPSLYLLYWEENGQMLKLIF